MPALPAVPNVMKFTHIFDVGTDTAATTRWFLSYTGAPPTDANCTAFAVAAMTAAAAGFPALLDTDSSLQGIEVMDLSSDMGGTGSSMAGHSGTRTGEYLSGGTAVLVHQPIARRYRGGKPRTYWPFLTASDVVTRQAWSSAATVAVAGALETYLAALEGLVEGSTTIVGLVNVSYYQGCSSYPSPTNPDRYKVRSTPRAVPVVNVVTSLSVGPAPASQRRRN